MYCYVKRSVPHPKVAKKEEKKAWSPGQFWGIGRTRNISLTLHDHKQVGTKLYQYKLALVLDCYVFSVL